MANEDPERSPLEGTVTLMLRRARDGDRDAEGELFAYVQDDLRTLARKAIRTGAWPQNGVQATELINMACVRLLGRAPIDANDRRHFFFLLGRAMHDVLVEEARRATAQKRGGGRQPAPLVEFEVEKHGLRMDMLQLREALEELRAHDPDGARVVSMLFFSGRTLRETAELLGCTLATVRDHWSYARAWLQARVDEPE